MFSSCYLTRKAADIDLGASMKCWMFYAIEIAHQKIVLSQLLCYLNKMCLLLLLTLLLLLLLLPFDALFLCVFAFAFASVLLLLLVVFAS